MFNAPCSRVPRFDVIITCLLRCVCWNYSSALLALHDGNPATGGFPSQRAMKDCRKKCPCHIRINVIKFYTYVSDDPSAEWQLAVAMFGMEATVFTEVHAEERSQRRPVICPRQARVFPNLKPWICVLFSELCPRDACYSVYITYPIKKITASLHLNGNAILLTKFSPPAALNVINNFRSIEWRQFCFQYIISKYTVK